LLLAVALGCLTSAPAAAAPSACGTHPSTNYFEGYESHPSSTSFINGIEVDLKLRFWGYCTSANHNLSEWVMLAPDGSNSNQNGWAQVGYQHESSSGAFDFFWQLNDGIGNCCDGGAGWASAAVGDQDTFKVERDTPPGCNSSSGHCLVMTVNGNKCHQENGQSVCMISWFDPESLWSSGTRSIASAESPYAGDDVAGYDGSRTHWTHLTEKDGNWTTLALSLVGPSCPYWHHDKISQAAFDTWTDPLVHHSDCTS
jgi:hypothetical protein